ncbi:MAG: YheU family protein [Planctomycetota bacterium]
MADPEPIRIDADLLDTATLRSVVEEFVTRDGAEFSESGNKVAEVMVLLARGEVEIWYDPDSSTCNLLRAASS